MKEKLFLANRAACALGICFLFAGTPAALAQSHTTMDKRGSMDKMHSSMPGMAAGGDMQDSMKGMMKHMESMKMSGDMDRDFATMMKMHHQGAIDMAKVELANGKDPEIRKLAEGVIAAQEAEIKQMQDWKTKWAQ